MSNMFYCRFQNTLTDLKECQEALGNNEELSEEEQAAKERLILVCKDILEDEGFTVEQ